MQINQLPEVIENIILDYKAQLEHTHKFNKVLNDIKKIQRLQYKKHEVFLKYGDEQYIDLYFVIAEIPIYAFLIVFI